MNATEWTCMVGIGRGEEHRIYNLERSVTVDRYFLSKVSRDGQNIETIYTISRTQEGPQCNCQGWRTYANCKHVIALTELGLLSGPSADRMLLRQVMDLKITLESVRADLARTREWWREQDEFMAINQEASREAPF